MEKARQVKILSIVALVIAIAGMTLGFAAFSTTLSISSSAIVTPNSDDFKIKVYGFKDATVITDSIERWQFSDGDLSDSYGVAIENDAIGMNASIDNNLHIISNLKVLFENKPGNVVYAFVIKNEGKYDAYLDLSNMVSEDGGYLLAKILKNTCTSDGDATASLVEKACKGINATVGIIDQTTGDGKFITSDHYLVPAGGIDVLALNIDYSGPYADGPFEVEFEDFQLKFSTTK